MSVAPLLDFVPTLPPATAIHGQAPGSPSSFPAGPSPAPCCRPVCGPLANHSAQSWVSRFPTAPSICNSVATEGSVRRRCVESGAVFGDTRPAMRAKSFRNPLGQRGPGTKASSCYSIHLSPRPCMRGPPPPPVQV